YAVVLHQLLVQRHPVHEKLDPGHVQLVRQLPVYIFEGLSIARPVVRRDANAEQDDIGAARPRRLDDRAQVRFDALRGETPQPVVATEFQHHELGLEARERIADAGRAALRGLAADAGVYDPMFVPFVSEALLQQSRPRLVNVYTVARAQ